MSVIDEIFSRFGIKRKKEGDYDVPTNALEICAKYQENHPPHIFESMSFVYSQELIIKDTVMSGWAVGINHDDDLIYIRYSDDPNKGQVTKSKISFHAANAIRNLLTQDYFFFHSMPDVINKKIHNTGIKHYMKLTPWEVTVFNPIFIPWSWTRTKECASRMSDIDHGNVIVTMLGKIVKILREYDGIELTYDGVELPEYSEPMAQGLSELYRTLDLPYKYGYSGVNFDAYAEDKESAPVFCECNRTAIENLILLFDRYYQNSRESGDRKKLLIDELGLPKYYKNILTETDKPWSEWMGLLNFKECMCPICNHAIIKEPYYYRSSPSKFEQRYEQEYLRKFCTYGLSSKVPGFFGYYYLKDKMPENIRKIIFPSEDVLCERIAELLEISVDEARSRLDTLKHLPGDAYNVITLCQDYYNKEHLISSEYSQKYHADTEIAGALYIINKNAYSQVKKMIKKEIQDEAKTAVANKANGGRIIDVTINMAGLKGSMIIDKEMNTIEYKEGKKRKMVIDKKAGSINMVVQLLDYPKLEEDSYHGTEPIKKPLWTVTGEDGKRQFIGITPSKRVLSAWNRAAAMSRNMVKGGK